MILLNVRYLWNARNGLIPTAKYQHLSALYLLQRYPYPELGLLTVG